MVLIRGNLLYDEPSNKECERILSYLYKNEVATGAV